jgi:hypothetical protein
VSGFLSFFGALFFISIFFLVEFSASWSCGRFFTCVEDGILSHGRSESIRDQLGNGINEELSAGNKQGLNPLLPA